ncbi:transmembrane protease serine 6-like [Narcine bancroftii]|uniref:transmembrane protease serine 6-like n=1 Tax=Narcine bancroftii TaxID=1343680 RepID=UPI003831D08E
MSSIATIEAVKPNEVKTLMPTGRVMKMLAIASVLLLALIVAGLVAFLLVFYLSPKCTDNEACRGSDYAACGCGQQKTKSDRIVGGSSTFDGEWPFVASVQLNGIHICGATLISCRWLLSAAHCFKDSNTENWAAVLGVHFLDQLKNNVQKRTIAKIIIHPLANPNFDYDVALLELSQPVDYTNFVQPACLPVAVTSISGRRCTAIGWGKTSENGLPSNELLKTEVKVYNNTQCQRYMPKITEHMICAGVPEGGKDACQGDSGGPLLCQDLNSHSWVVSAIVSFGIGCGRPNHPGVYTHTTPIRQWIKEVIYE